MSIENEIQQLEAKIQNAVNEQNRAQGVYDAAMERLKNEHGCTTIEEAEALLKKYEEEAKEHGQKAQLALDECRKLIGAN